MQAMQAMQKTPGKEAHNNIKRKPMSSLGNDRHVRIPSIAMGKQNG
jgi:hypothetical protein